MFACPSARLVAMREEKVENMAHDATPAPPKKQKRASAAAATASPSPSPYNTPPGSVGPTMSDDMYMLMDEEEKTSVSMSGGRSGARSDKELLKVVTDGDSYDDGYRYQSLLLCCFAPSRRRHLCLQQFFVEMHRQVCRPPYCNLMHVLAACVVSVVSTSLFSAICYIYYQLGLVTHRKLLVQLLICDCLSTF